MSMKNSDLRRYFSVKGAVDKESRSDDESRKKASSTQSVKSAIREPLDIVGKPSTSSDQSIDNNQNHSKEFRSELAFNSDGRTVPFDQPLARPRKEISLIEDYSGRKHATITKFVDSSRKIDQFSNKQVASVAINAVESQVTVKDPLSDPTRKHPSVDRTPYDDKADDSEVLRQEDSDIDDAPAVKKARKAIQKFSKEWMPNFPWLTQSSDKHAGFCKVCNKDIKCLGGLKDFAKHASTEKHKKREISVQQKTKIEKFATTSLSAKVKNAELQLCAWGAAHNKSASEIEEFAAFMRRICTDSDIAKGLKVGRTKATAVIKNVFGEGQHEELSSHLQQYPFSLIADESTDLSNKKTLALVARTYFWDDDKLLVKDCFYDLIQVTETDSATLYEKVVSSFENDNIPYRTNLIGYAADGANNMTAAEKSLGAFLKKDCPSLFVLKCICHSFALCSSYACKHIPDSIEQMCRDIYSYLSCSPLRTSKFEEIQELLELKPLKMLHPCATRWLSLQSVVQRILDRYEALRIYFGFLTNVAHVEKAKVLSIYEALNNPSTMLYLTFLSYILNLVNQMNKLFQNEKPEIQILHSSVSRLFRTVLDNYFSCDYMKELTDLSKIEFEPKNYERLENVYVGTAAEQLVKEYVQNKTITLDQLNDFKLNVMRFYITLSHQILKRINFDDLIMKNLSILDPENVINRRHRSILPLLDNFSNVVPQDKFQELDKEFREIRNIDFSTYSKQETSDVIGFWGKVLSTRTYGDELAFPQLRQFIPTLLVLPHSSAAVERIFSDYNINKTKARNRLEVTTMRGILATKNYVKLNTDDSGSINISSVIESKYNVNMYGHEKN